MPFDVTSLFDRRADNRWDRCSVGDILERVATVRPDAEAFVGTFGAASAPAFERLTYAAADVWANRFANALIGRGTRRGDRVLMICENSVEAFLAEIGVAKAGCVAVPINPSQVTDFLTHAVQLVEPSMVVADSEFLALPRAIGLTVTVTIPIGGEREVEGTSFLDFCSEGSSDPPEVTIHGDDIWQILFTSGTTAMPKGVMVSHAYSYLLALGWALTHTRGLAHESLVRTACFSPIIFHIGYQAYTMPALICGGTVILGRGFRPPVLARAIVEERVTNAITGGRALALRVLTELEAMHDGRPLALTSVIHGLGLLTTEEIDRFRAMAPRVAVVYIAGQTESCMGHRLAYDARPEQHAEAMIRDVNMVGSPMALLASRVVDIETGTSAVENGSVGELVYRSPAMTAGYYRDDDETRAAFAGGWFHSGDLGSAEPGGERLMVGRVKDMIKTGGENVAATRVESIVRQHPAVANVAVIGLPDERWGETVTAVVTLVQGAQSSEASIIDFCRTRLPGYETPKRVIVVSELPLDFAGTKVRKRDLKAQILRTLEAGATAPPA